MPMDSQDYLKIFILNAMRWLKQSWNEVTEATIKNCFKYCSFRQDVSASEDPLGQDPDLQSLFEELQQHGASIDGTCEIVDSVLSREEEYEDEANNDDDEPIVCPTVSAYWAALTVVSCYVVAVMTLNTIKLY